MKEKFLTITIVITMLFALIGCGEGKGGSNRSTNSSKIQTKLILEFKSSKQAKEGYQKVNRDDVATVSITISKDGIASIKNASMIKNAVTNKWEIGINLDFSLAPYDVLVIAKDNSGNILFKTKVGTTISKDELVTGSIVLPLEEVTAVINLLPLVKSITHDSNGNDINIHFVINNAIDYELSSFSGGTFNTSTGILSSTVESTLDTIYSKSVTETDILLQIKISNVNGDTKTVKFNIGEDANSNSLTINFPPAIQIDVEEQLIPSNSYKITAIVTDDDSSLWSYNWSHIRGAKLMLTDNPTSDIIELEGLTKELYPMCFKLTVTDDEGASSSVDYCIKNANNGYIGIKKTGQTKSYKQNGDETTDKSIHDDGFYQKGLTPEYTRDDTTQMVIDHVTGLVWQDDEDVKTLSKTWSEAKDYCEAKGDGWRLPTIKELIDISEINHNEIMINEKFNNINDSSDYSSKYWSSDKYLTSESLAWVINFSNGIVKAEGKSPISVNKIYVRCIFDK